MSSELTGPICVRLPVEMAQIAREIAAAQGINFSEWIRILVSNAIYGVSPDVDSGYVQARGLALKLAHELIRQAEAMLPPTYEQAQSYFGLAGPVSVG